CPTCKLKFEWADAAPNEELTCGHCGYHLYGLSETRCPECGEQFTRDEALCRYRTSQKPLFEYRWRDRPIRSFFHTWRRSLSPRKFWASISLHDPPRVVPLFVMVLIEVGAAALAGTVLLGLEAWVRDYAFGSGRNWLMDLPGYVLNTLVGPRYKESLLPTGAWLLGTLFALFVFQQSMRIYKVRNAHLIRLWAYSAPVALLPAVLGWRVFALQGALRSVYVPLWIGPLFALLLVLYAARSLRIGYRDYLRMPQSAALALASQTIAVLATGIMTLRGSSMLVDQIMYPVLRSLGLW
ncbi:MAG: zinc ribbon domain-containing protein, partial [Phycisphaerales bacterium]|nr:zinc ribbon domain-containing protein [Phycisphaerales bacterium]